jgi:hypothetical protein
VITKAWASLLVIVASFTPSTGNAHAASSGCPSRLVQWPSPNPGGSSNVVDVVATPQGTSWAVGFTVPSMGGSETVALHEREGVWRRVRTPDPNPVSNRFDAVDGLADDDAWAVGSRQTGDDGTLVEHWNGTSWRVVPSPSPPDSFSSFDSVSVASSTDVWAVGSAQAFSGGSVRTLIEHWDGTRWRIVPSPNSGDYNFLLDVSARSATDAWAVGIFYDSTGAHNLVVHWDGRRWGAVAVPSPGLEDNTLESVVALRRNDAWTVGFAADQGVSSRRPTTLHWDGAAWSMVPSPVLSGQLNSVAAPSSGKLWAVGYREDPPTTLAERWDGSRWRVIGSANRSGDSFDNLFGVTAGSNRDSVWAVGSTATTQSTLRSLIERPCHAGE